MRKKSATIGQALSVSLRVVGHRPARTKCDDGVYTVDFGKVTGVDGKQAPGATPTTETCGFRSVCRPEGCVANASRLSGDTMQIPTMVFDQVGDSWVPWASAQRTAGSRRRGVGGIQLQPRPDGTLPGNPTS
ncbi:MAG: hypothetical protein WBR28_08890 [Mycobacterium sp.]